jgi:hypothetical protein
MTFVNPTRVKIESPIEALLAQLMARANNLSDVADAAAARQNLGVVAKGAETTNRADVVSVPTDEGTTSTAYADLVTIGPEVTVTVGASGRVLLVLGALARNSLAAGTSHMSFSAAGPTAVAAGDGFAIVSEGTTEQGEAYAGVVEALSPGSYTFRGLYRAGSGTASFRQRRISVIPL